MTFAILHVILIPYVEDHIPYKMYTIQTYQAYKIYVASSIITKYMGLKKNRFYGAINQL